MTLSDVLNNTATAIVGAPIALEMANKLNVNPDPFLMTVAVAASCAFLTPIGHKKQYFDYGTWWLSIWRLLADGIATGNFSHLSFGASDPYFLAALINKYIAR